MTAKVLVTGGDGQIANALKTLGSGARYRFYSRNHLNICEFDTIAAAFESINPDLVLNTAAYTLVDAAEDNREEAQSVNAFGPKILSIACARLGIPLIHLSTDYVFDGKTDRAYSVGADTQPLGIYGQTKLEGEKFVRSILSEHVILRLSGVFSSYANCFPRAILQTALRHQNIKVVNDQITGQTNANKVAYILDLIIDQVLAGSFAWGTYHFAQQPFLSWFEFAEMIINCAHKFDGRFGNIKVQAVASHELSSRSERPGNSSLDSSELLEQLNLDRSILKRQSDLDDVVKDIVSALRA